MTATVDEAIRLLTAAGAEIAAEDEATLPLTRAEICRRLMAYCRDEPAQRARLRWDTAVLGLANDAADAGWFVRRVEESVLGLETSEDASQIGESRAEASRNVETFGDVVLHLEQRLRDLWWSGASEGCPSQAIFYELRRTILAQGGYSSPGRLRPRTGLRDCLRADHVDLIRPFLERRFGVEELPVEDRVFGATGLELGATWLALWFPCFLYWLIICADPGVPRSWFWPGFILPPLLITLLLGLLSRPTWIRVRTLGDLTHWLLRRNAQVIQRVQQAGESWA